MGEFGIGVCGVDVWAWGAGIAVAVGWVVEGEEYVLYWLIVSILHALFGVRCYQCTEGAFETCKLCESIVRHRLFCFTVNLTFLLIHDILYLVTALKEVILLAQHLTITGIIIITMPNHPPLGMTRTIAPLWCDIWITRVP